jgi:hypothetical protein
MAVPGCSQSLITSKLQIEGRVWDKAVAAPIPFILFHETDDGADSAGHELAYLQLGFGRIKASWITAGEELAGYDPIGPGIGEIDHLTTCIVHGVESTEGSFQKLR